MKYVLTFADARTVELAARIVDDIVLQGSKSLPGIQINDVTPRELSSMFGEEMAYFIRECLEYSVNEGSDLEGDFEEMENFDSELPAVQSFRWKLHDETGEGKGVLY